MLLAENKNRIFIKHEENIYLTLDIIICADFMLKIYLFIKKVKI